MSDLMERYLTLYSGRMSRVSAEEGTVYRMACVGGSGLMTCYPVFPGISLNYNDFHAVQCPEAEGPEDIIQINHCRRGRFECQFENGAYVYLGEGDLSISAKQSEGNAGFPLGYYEGVELVIDIRRAGEALTGVLEGISIDLDALQRRFFQKEPFFVMRATPNLEHIFRELYQVDPQIRQGFFKLKVLELLLFLGVVPVETVRPDRLYFQRAQVEKVKRVRELLTHHLDQELPLAALAEHQGLSLTALKTCFKAVYGTSPYAYRKEFRVHTAARLLRETDLSVAEIAGRVGYENASKFTAAFQSVLQATPKAYRASD